LVRVRDHGRVARARELVSERFEPAAELSEVVELAVEDGDDVAALVAHRLVAGREVDDREAPVAEHAPSVGLDGAVVGAAMYDRRVHALDRSGVRLVPAEESANPAHARKSRLRGRLLPRRTSPRRPRLGTFRAPRPPPSGRLRDHGAPARAVRRRGPGALRRPRARGGCARAVRPPYALDVADGRTPDRRRPGRARARGRAL